MAELLQENWILFLIALVIGIAVAWWIFVASRRVRVETAKRDTLDEGAERTKRNQALIDAPPAASAGYSEIPPATPVGMAGAGEAVAFTARPVHETGEPAPPEPAGPIDDAAEMQETGPSADDLRRIKGVGPKVEALLHSLGVTSFRQIADWDEGDIDRIDAQLGKFQGRIRRDHWVEQARLLASGDQAGYEDRFGRI